MRRQAGVLIFLISVIAAFAAVASAHSTPYAWTAARSQLELQATSAIALPPAERQALDAELEGWLTKFRRLVLISGEDPDNWALTGAYNSYITRFVKAQETVNAGLSIDSVRCVGLGKPLKGKRYKHLRCNATSYVLEIPNIELKPGADPDLPEVVEGPRRVVGPLQAVFTVHVMGKARMVAQRAS